MNTLSSLFEWLLATTARASVLAVIILSIQLLLRRSLPAPWRYALWLPMLLVLVLPALPSVPFRIFPWQNVETFGSVIETSAVSATAVSEIGKSAGPAASGQPHVSKMSLLAIAWLIGTCGILGTGMIGYRRNMRLILKNAVVPDETLHHLIKHAAWEIGLSRVPRVLVSTAVDSPAVTGIIRPCLLLPAGFPDGFSDTEARLILLHEFTHLKRQDLPVNWLACGLQALHWFNPILWFAFARMRADREAACDAKVLSIDSADRRVEYGGALLKLQSAFPARGLSLGFVGIFERAAGMKSRIRDISSHRPAHFSGRASGACIVALLVLFGATKAQEPGKPPGRASIEKKLDAIVIPQLDAENAELREIVDFLRLRAMELDTEKNPAQKGINFVIMKSRADAGNPFKPGLITLQTKNTTLRQTIVEVCKQAGMKFKVEDFGLTFLPPGEIGELENAGPNPQQPLSGGKAAEFAKKIIIPSIDFGDVTLREAVDFLNMKSRELAKGGPIFPIVLDAKANPDARIREMRLRNLPLSVALKYCIEATNHTMTANDHEIRIQLP